MNRFHTSPHEKCVNNFVVWLGSHPAFRFLAGGASAESTVGSIIKTALMRYATLPHYAPLTHYFSLDWRHKISTDPRPQATPRNSTEKFRQQFHQTTGLPKKRIVHLGHVVSVLGVKSEDDAMIVRMMGITLLSQAEIDEWLVENYYVKDRLKLIKHKMGLIKSVD